MESSVNYRVKDKGLGTKKGQAPLSFRVPPKIYKIVRSHLMSICKHAYHMNIIAQPIMKLVTMPLLPYTPLYFPPSLFFLAVRHFVGTV